MTRLPEPKTVLADNMRLYRKMKSYTQETLAEKASVGRTHIGNIEQESGNPTLACLTKIAEALEVEVEDLVSRRNPARYRLGWGRNLVRDNPEVVMPENFAPGDYAICHWDHDQLIMTPLMVDDRELNDFLISYLLMNGETENLSAKAQKIMEAVRETMRELRHQR